MRFVRPFESLTLDDIPLVGGKNASFGEMIRALQPLGVRVPGGFALTADAYKALLDGPGVRGELRAALAGSTCATSTRCGPAARSRGARSARRRSRRELLRELEAAYAALSKQYGRGGHRRRGALERHRRGPPDGELRGPAGDLPERPRRCRAARRLPQVLRVALHRPRDRLPRRARLRPREGLPLDRRAEDGPLGPGRLGRAVHARHRERLRPRRADHRHLRPRREHRAGRRQPRRVRRLQADPRGDLPAPRLEGDRDGLRRGRRPRARATCRCPRRCAASSCSRATRRSSSRATPSRSRSTTARAPASARPMDIEWAKDGRTRRALHRAGAARDGALAARRRRSS